MNSSNSNVIQAFQIADAAISIRHVFIRDLILTCLIGVHKRERKKPQRIRINLDLAVRDEKGTMNDTLEDVVCYEDVANGIRLMVKKGHVNLVETLAHGVAEILLKEFGVPWCKVRVNKRGAVTGAVDVGVVIERGSR